MAKPVIVLMSDFGAGSPFPGIMKGVIRKIYPDGEIIDFTHEVSPCGVKEAAFLLATSFNYFPQRAIFTCVVDPGVGSERKIVLAETKNYFFLAPDNGLLSWVLEKGKPNKIVEVKNKKFFLKPVSSTFQGRDIFAPVAAHLAKGERIENFGPKIRKIEKIESPTVKRRGDLFEGEVIYVDKFGDCITNFPKEKYENLLKGDTFSLKIRNKVLRKINRSYQEVKKGKPCLVWGSFGFLEVALREDNLSRKWHISPGEKIILTRARITTDNTKCHSERSEESRDPSLRSGRRLRQSPSPPPSPLEGED